MWIVRLAFQRNKSRKLEQGFSKAFSWIFRRENESQFVTPATCPIIIIGKVGDVFDCKIVHLDWLLGLVYMSQYYCKYQLGARIYKCYLVLRYSNIEVTCLEITPDDVRQRHEVIFDLDQSYLPSLIAQVDSLIARLLRDRPAPRKNADESIELIGA